MYNKKNGEKTSIILITIIATTTVLIILGFSIYRLYSFSSKYVFNSNKNLLNKGKTLLDQKDYYGAINYFNQAEKNEKTSSVLYSNLGQAYLNIDKYEDALTNFNKSLAISSKNPTTLTFKAYDYVMLEDYTKADEFCSEALKLDPRNAFAYNVKGLVYYSNYKDKDAITSFDKAISLNSTYYDPYINKIKTIYSQKEYLDCIAFSKEALKTFPNKIDIYLYISDCLSQTEKHEDAINQLKLALKIAPKDPIVLSNLGWEYFYMEKSDEASSYADKALSLSPDLEDALKLKDSLEKDSLSESVKIVNFVKANYLYFDKITDFDKKAKAFEDKTTLTSQDITKFIDDIKIKGDNFTFTLTDSDFDELEKEENTSQLVSKSIDENTFYMKINSFNSTVDIDFKNVLQKIKDPKQKTLVLDLRDDTGGVMRSANRILDLFLPDCTTSFTINRDGTIYPYYSDENQIEFKKIVVLVDEYTASSSELLTLGLKKYLNNVVVVGHTTFGKGVGQVTYDNKDKKYSIFLVSFHWNVKEKNIASIGITPDIIVKGSLDSDYMKEVN